MLLYRYICRECKTKYFLDNYRDSWLLKCPCCACNDTKYDREVEILTTKGDTKRKTRFISMYKSDNMNFYIDGHNSENIEITGVIGNSKTSFVKNIQHFGIKINRYS